ncbi:hypothetical protein C5Y96_05090 [Blastopirellula marina]|uniref:Uncharacterized protein n=1 Tax=Blastopirellula marina TaxID=124 RepID=A0A2S8G464_9BACT|nr:MULTISPECIES: hypothetical protein [Pirellulaceae]PQO39235.1 hypothetical protein C5Y96_05090 [Blastopirellula marina]RCS55543.1 hypothetical protein DTL36_05100 [Bremerella cremea]
MSQLFDYYACTQAQIQELAEAISTMDEERQENIEAAMPAIVKLKNLNQDDFSFLAACASGDDFDLVEEVGASELFMAIDEAEGPFILTYTSSATQAIAELTVTDALLERWIQASTEFSGTDSQYARDLLTKSSAERLQGLCKTAIEKELEVFVCVFI